LSRVDGRATVRVMFGTKLITRGRVLAVSLALLGVGCTVSSEDGGGLAQAVTSEGARFIVTVQADDYAGDMRRLAARGLDVAGADLETREIDLVVDRAALAALRADGFHVTSSIGITPPGRRDFNAGVESYQTPESLETALRGYVESFPTLAAMESIGTSLEGRSIWALKISKNVSQHSPEKPVVLYNGMHHARELMSTEVPLDTIDTLLTGYGQDPEITHWVDANEIWVVPMLNVDGNHHVWEDDTFWRKNARGCPASGRCRAGTGVDINRNYAYGWGSCHGSSTSPRADDYRGPSAASEPETRAMAELVERIRPVFDISYHSFSEVVLYPYGCDGVHAPTRAILEDIGAKMAAGLPTDEGAAHYRSGTPWELLYPADGADLDWMYHDYGVVPFGIEVNSRRQGFQPDYGLWRQKTVTKLRSAWELLLRRLDGTAIRGIARTADGSIATGAKVDVLAAGQLVQSRDVNPDGSFHIVLLPGSYTVTIHDPTHTFTKDVTVADKRIDVPATLE
jgi:carboxypeptidase T